MLLAERNKVARDFIKFRALMATPSTGSITMPANGRLAVSDSAGGRLTVKVGNRTITTPVLTPNQIYPIDWIEKAKVVLTTSKLYILDEWNRPFLIRAQDSFAPVSAFSFNFLNGTLPANTTLTRSSTGWYFDAVNSIRNPTFTGGINGSPGTFPTNMSTSYAGGMITTQAFGTEDEIPYWQITFAGIPTNGGTNIFFETLGFVVATPEQTWGISAYLSMPLGSMANISGLRLSVQEFTSANGFIRTADSNNANIIYPNNGLLKNQSVGGTLITGGGATASIRPVIGLTYTPNLPVNITLRIGLPRLGTLATLTSAGTNIPRFRYNPSTIMMEGLLNEPAATDSWRNSSALGSVPPNALPTNWTGASTSQGITRTVIGSGTEDGIPYVDIRYNGTLDTASSKGIFPESSTFLIPAASGQTWVGSWYLKIVAGSLANCSLIVEQQQRLIDGTVIKIQTTPVSPTTASLRTQRFDITIYLDEPSVQRLVGDMLVSPTLGLPMDVTLRVGLPQFVQTTAPLSPIVTTNAAVTRAVDILTLSGISPGIRKVRITRESGSTDLIASIYDGTYIVPNDASPVKRVDFDSTVTPITGDVDVLAWANQVVLNGGTIHKTRLDLISTFVVGLKTDAIWALIDDMWILAAENAIQALVSIKQKRLTSAVNSPAFTIDRGYLSNGTSSYLDTGMLLNTHKVSMTDSNIHIALYERNNLSSSGMPFGTTGGVGKSIYLNPRNSSGRAELTLLNNTGAAGDAVTESRGFWIGTRSGTLTTDIKCYRNAVAVLPYVATAWTAGLTATAKLFLLASNNGANTAFSHRPASEAFFSIGASIPAGSIAAFNTRVQTLMTTLGAQAP